MLSHHTILISPIPTSLPPSSSPPPPPQRENSIFDYLTVSETAHDPPSASEDCEEVNYPEKLSLEATMINQNFSQQVLVEPSDATRKTFEPNPFFEDDDQGSEPAAVAYRYRKFGECSSRCF